MSVVTPTILSDGSPMDPTYGVISIDVRAEVNRIPTAELRLFDGDLAKRTYRISDGLFFEPGKTIEIKLRHEGKNDEVSVFKGLVVRQVVEAGPEGTTLVVGLKDIAVKLTGSRKSAVHPGKTDDAIFKEMLSAAGVEVGVLEPTTAVHATMVQYDCTAWDFIVLRAEAVGMLVTASAGKVSVGPMLPKGGGEPQHKFSLGIDTIYDLEIEADAEHPFQAVASVAWDPMQIALTNPAQSAAVVTLPGNLVPGALAAAVGREACALKHPIPVAANELQLWADARLARSQLATLRGRLSVPGNAKIMLLDTMEISGVGKRFNGSTRVTGLRHRYDGAGFRTDVSFGLSPERLCEREDIAEVSAQGLLPPARGLQIGVVAAFEEDPQKELRVKVVLPGVDDKPTGAIWARLASPDAGMNRGFFFRPEMGDEVVVGFLHDDPRHPVILGSLFGSKNMAPAGIKPPSALNDAKGFVTKKGTTIGFLDIDKPSVYIETISKNRLVIDDAAGGISLTDQNGNSIILNAQGITIDAGPGNVTIKGAKVDVS